MLRGPRGALADWSHLPRTARWEGLPGSGGGGCHGDRGLAGAAMSFKRDESDPGPLGALQKRRVAELLASAIPEDEALLLRDGRLACSLCPHRPVCDTLQTLVLHRAGRKHLDSLQRSYGRPRSAQVTPEGPQVTPAVTPTLQAPLLARTRRLARSALLPSAPYSPCCRRATKSSRIPKNSQNLSRNPEIHTHREGEKSPQIPGDLWEFQGIIPGSQISQKNSQISQKNSQISPGPSPERLRLLRHHLNLRSQGWIQDPAGNWVKDANAEFDSDEEEPPPLPPP
ncbi:sodium channel modifier 1 [Catharus ustulatus]|uniref:sodium channel modifier 1 n=1 Tax=Catharus ustulatus TaxID=91951 RepID=UPI001408E7F6|nr:sodium channel modifier 1 [Catharus ustulatus]